MAFIMAALAVLATSFFVTAIIRKYALANSIIDVPNARSSHTVPTPRGGGVAIVVAFLLALAVLIALGQVPVSGGLSLLAGAALIAIIGFIDDKGHIPAKWRLVGHFAAAVWIVAWLGGFPPISIIGVEVGGGWLVSGLAVIYIVWLLNLYNFMDGIDGLAGVQAVTVCLGISALYWLGGDHELIWLPLALALAVTGFLIWNFPPAKIFMGDAGSGFLGFALGAMSIAAAWARPAYFWAWLILLGVFVVDATYTLLRRLIRGDRVHEAHRSHGYQFASRLHRGHLPITVAIGLINVLWLLPIAYGVVSGKLEGVYAIGLAYLPLVALAFKYRAGAKETAE